MARVGSVTAFVILFSFTIIKAPLYSEDTFVRDPSYAGSFYPSNPRELTAMIRGFMEQGEAIPIRKEKIAGILAPHAGYVYSGRTAAKAYREIGGNRYDLVILLGPSHFVPVEKAAIMIEGAFRTPLGLVSIDTRVAREVYFRIPDLFENSIFPFAREHSLEVQLPFLQAVLGKFTFLPIEVNILDRSLLERVADAIFNAVRDRNVLVVASTDLSHYRSRRETGVLDGLFRQRIEELDEQNLIRDLQGRKCEACGGAASVLALMIWKRLGVTSAYITGYADSGDTTGDTGSVVGYLSAVALKIDGGTIQRRREKMKEVELSRTGYLTHSEQRELLDIARKTINEFVKAGKMPEITVSSEKLKTPGAAFVTIEIGGKLRGCIGYTKAIYPLYRTVMECAVSSATEDPRFSPLTSSELEHIVIEISVLTPLTKVEDISGIQVGKHGLMVSKMNRRGLLLPQVAVNNGWDRETFLAQTCVKAGLPPNEWKQEIGIYSFEADVFSDEEYR